MNVIWSVLKEPVTEVDILGIMYQNTILYTKRPMPFDATTWFFNQIWLENDCRQIELINDTRRSTPKARWESLVKQREIIGAHYASPPFYRLPLDSSSARSPPSPDS